MEWLAAEVEWLAAEVEWLAAEPGWLAAEVEWLGASWGGGSRPSRPNLGGGETATSAAASMTNYAPG
ncbi:hypothetical protein CAURIC_10950 [Corynebacterium auriscanis]|nr:hypothetical protein CAURIC_10950 [Corynebacterium auriscanis]